ISMKKGTFRAKVMKIIYFYLAFTIAVSLHFLIRTVVPANDNKQLLRFLEVRFGLNIGTPVSTDNRVEEVLIGERPEVIYHVVQTILLGSLAMVFEG
ncbi:hypothetical protein XELAEV_180322518mg, partial [Xenopus laevis]